MQKISIRLSIGFLGVASLIMMFNELMYHFADSGMLKGAFSTMPGSTVGFFEAHGLAFLWAVYLVRRVISGWEKDIHLYAGLVHLLLGFANTIFWTDIFVRFDLLWVGWLSTSLHYLLIILHFYNYFKKS